MRNRRASTTFRTSSGISFGIAASTMTNRSQTLPDEAFPLPLTRNLVPGLVLAGTLSVSFFPSSVSRGTSAQRRKSKNGMDRLTVTSRESAGASWRFARPDEWAECDCAQNGDEPAKPPHEKRSEKSNVCERPRACPAHEKAWKRSSKPPAPPPGKPEKPPASALPKAS